MNSRWLWNSHQRHKFLRAEAARDIFRGIQEVCSTVDAMFFIRIHTRLGIIPSKCPRCSTTSHSLNISHVHSIAMLFKTEKQNGALQLYSMVLIFC